MADKTIVVRENTSPTLTFKLTTFRDESDPSLVVDVSAYNFTLRVWRAHLDAADPEQLLYDVLFELAATGMASDGTFDFVLTHAHTSLAPGLYPAEIVWWATGTPATDVPTDAWSVEYIVRARRDTP